MPEVEVTVVKTVVSLWLVVGVKVVAESVVVMLGLTCAVTVKRKETNQDITFSLHDRNNGESSSVISTD